MSLLLILSGIAAVAGSLGAIFATWRWDYARKAYAYQKKQLYLQVLMLAESREYWQTPKMEYVNKKRNHKVSVDKEIKHIVRELELAFD